MVIELWQVIITVAGTLGGTVVVSRATRKSKQVDDQANRYDQLQEDLAATRAALNQMNAERAHDRQAAIDEREKDRRHAEEDREEIRYLVNLVNSMEDQLDAIYDGFRLGTIPPLPPRAPRPARVVR